LLSTHEHFMLPKQQLMLPAAGVAQLNAGATYEPPAMEDDNAFGKGLIIRTTITGKSPNESSGS